MPTQIKIKMLAISIPNRLLMLQSLILFTIKLLGSDPIFYVR